MGGETLHAVITVVRKPLAFLLDKQLVGDTGLRADCARTLHAMKRESHKVLEGRVPVST